jgi:hypothetical protein
MNRAALVTVFALGLLSACAATERAQLPTVGQQVQPAVRDTKSRGDLEPVDELLTRTDQEIVRRLLLGDPPGDFWMLCTPSFTPPFAVAITESEAASAPGASTAHPTVLYAIEVARVDKLVEPDQAPPHITHDKLAIDVESMKSITGAWRAIVRRARYKEPEYAIDESGEQVEITYFVRDGVGFEFQVGEFHAKTRSPGPGLASDLINLARDLIACVEMPRANQPAALSKCVETAKKLRADAERAPSN